MVVGMKKTMQQVPSRGRISLMRLQHFTVERRQSVIKLVYGALFLIIALVTVLVNPVEVATNFFMEVKENSFLFNMYANPPYELFCEVWIFNYTNVPEYLNGNNTKLKVEEIGPFLFQEVRTNENLKVDREAGIMNFTPKTKLNFIRELSIAHMKDIQISAPNIALVAMSTLFADKLGYIPNAAAYYSMKTIGSKLFLNLSAEELLWGYNDPVVTLANTFLPGWIDFDKIGIMDRFYAERKDFVEVEIKNSSTKFSIKSYNHSPGLKEQGFTDLNTSVPCNLIKGSYEGLMVTPPLSKEKVLPFFRRQACRIIPIAFEKEVSGKFGFNFYRYKLQDDTFDVSSDFACPCTRDCLPNGFVDVSNCYYGFPIAISKPHFQDTDPKELANYEGMHPDPVKFASNIDIEPSLGVPLALNINIQVNIAVRMSPGNPITKPLAGKVIPLIWLSMFCKEPPPIIINILRLRLVIAPPLLVTVEIVLFMIGVILGGFGFHRVLKPKYRLIDSAGHAEEMKPRRRKSAERRLSTVILNMSDNIGFKDDEDLAKEAVSLLSICEEDSEMPDLLMTDS